MLNRCNLNKKYYDDKRPGLFYTEKTDYVDFMKRND